MPVRKVVLEKSDRKIERERDRNKHYESRMLMPFGINLIRQKMFYTKYIGQNIRKILHLYYYLWNCTCIFGLLLYMYIWFTLFRWWKTLFYHVIDVAIINSFMLFETYRKLDPDNQDRVCIMFELPSVSEIRFGSPVMKEGWS